MTESVPSSLRHLLSRELAPGESVVWQGQPAPLGRVLATWQTFLFGIFWNGFWVFWLVGASGGFGHRDAEGQAFGRFAYFWAIPFMLAGASMLLSPLWAWWEAQRTLYVVTDRRAILISAPLRRVTVQSFTGDRLAGVIRHEGPSGCGDLIFEREASQGSRGRTHYRDVGFFGLVDARAVHRLLPTGSAVLPGAQR
jgi:hypothetical protein